MTAREAKNHHCAHKAVRFNNGDGFIFCDDCPAVWLPTETTNTIDVRVDFSRRGDPECALRTRPISEPPPKP